MEQSLSDRIAKREFNKKKSPGHQSRHKAAFLVLHKEISEALEKGWSIKIIWATLFEEDKISFTYKTFRLYVSRLIDADCLDPLSKQSELKSGNHCHKSLPFAATSIKEKPVSAIPSFTFHPKPNPEDLL